MASSARRCAYSQKSLPGARMRVPSAVWQGELQPVTCRGRAFSFAQVEESIKDVRGRCGEDIYIFLIQYFDTSFPLGIKENYMHGVVVKNKKDL